MTLLSIASSYNDSIQELRGFKYRAANLAMAPITSAAAIVDTISGLFCTMGSAIALGIKDDLNQIAMHQLESSNKILSGAYLNLLEVINPESRVVKNNSDPGLISSIVFPSIVNQAERFANSLSGVHKHITSRLTFALLAVSSLITRIADGVIGIIAATLSLITLGNSRRINTIAYRSLMAPGIIYDLSYCTLAIINPYF